MKIETTNIRTILEAIGESKQNDVLQVHVDSPRDTDIVLTINTIKREYPHTFFTFECFKAEGKHWMYIYIRSYKSKMEAA